MNSVDEMELDELRAYARELEQRLAHYERPDYVYFLQDPKTDLIKLGHSKDVENRRKALSRQVGHELRLLGVMSGGKGQKRRLKTQFQGFAVTEDDWLRAESELMTSIRENTRRLNRGDDQ